MSTVTHRQCDKCECLFSPTRGCLSLQVSVKRRDENMWDTWHEVDFCPKCSAEVLQSFGPALEGLDETLK